MMHPADNGVIVVCGPWDAAAAYIAEHGLDPDRVLRTGAPTYGLHLTADQVVILDGWEPEPGDVRWFWADVYQRMFCADDARALQERARQVAGLVPEALR